MMKLTYAPLMAAMTLGFMTVACGGGDDPITAENVTLEQCEELFGEDAGGDVAAGGAAPVEGDYNEDGVADEEDDAIKEKCDELMAEGE
jgi:hypothetical protein